jgi:3-oxoacyl-(acyl-carrier-protein) synthase
VVELIAALYSLRAGRVEGAFGLSQRDPALAAQNISPFEEGPRALSGRVALCNTFAFGGMNCSLLVGAP